MYFKCLTLTKFVVLLNWCWSSSGEVSVRTVQDLSKVEVRPRRAAVATDQHALEDGNTVKVREERLQCYLCSWSVMGPGNASEYDICSTGNFVRDSVPVVPCQFGCQSVSFRISEKEEIRHFYRNCLKQDDGKDLPTKDVCYNLRTVYGLEQRCECLSNLCNGSSSIKFQTTAAILASLLFLIPMAITWDLGGS